MVSITPRPPYPREVTLVHTVGGVTTAPETVRAIWRQKYYRFARVYLTARPSRQQFLIKKKLILQENLTINTRCYTRH